MISISSLSSSTAMRAVAEVGRGRGGTSGGPGGGMLLEGAGEALRGVLPEPEAACGGDILGPAQLRGGEPGAPGASSEILPGAAFPFGALVSVP